ERRQARVARGAGGDGGIERGGAPLEAVAVEPGLRAARRIGRRRVDALIGAVVVEAVGERAGARIGRRAAAGSELRAPALVTVVRAVDHRALVDHDVAAHDVDRLLVAAEPAVAGGAVARAAADGGDPQIAGV